MERLTFSAPFDTILPVVTIRMPFQNRQLRLVVDTGGPDLMPFQTPVPETAALQLLGSEDVANVRLKRACQMPAYQA
jgi:hypothetical protein